MGKLLFTESYKEIGGMGVNPAKLQPCQRKLLLARYSTDRPAAAGAKRGRMKRF
jgi:hypothetical protein